MPQITIEYTESLDLDFPLINETINTTILTNDDGAGVCKIRWIPAKHTSCDHILISIGLLKKPYRDKAFREKLVKTIYDALQNLLPQGITVCMNPYWLDDAYLAQVVD